MNLEIKGLKKSYGKGPERRPVLDLAAWSVASGETVAVSGASGSGKSTLIALLGGLDLPDEGAVLWNGEDLGGLREQDRDRWRRRNVGLLFQDFHLVEGLSALDNVILPTWFGDGLSAAQAKGRAAELLERLRIPHIKKTIEAFSRGEKQRICLARALLASPALLLADEPTASLDRQSEDEAIKLLFGEAQAQKATLIVTSHHPAVWERADGHRRLNHGEWES